MLISQACSVLPSFGIVTNKDTVLMVALSRYRWFRQTGIARAGWPIAELMIARYIGLGLHVLPFRQAKQGKSDEQQKVEI